MSILSNYLSGISTPQGIKVDQKKETPVVATLYSQPHVLQVRMQEANLAHGDRVTANISPVRLESNLDRMIMYFCPAQAVEVTNRLEAGDGGAIPPEVTLQGLTVPGNFKPGLYELKNVQLFSNGTMQVIATADTQFEAI